MGLFKKLFGKPVDEIFAPVSGAAIPVSEVPDPTFSQRMLGNGVAIIPSEGKLLAPCDAIVDTMFETGHAVSLAAACGADILIHVGLNTVMLQGRHFTIHVDSGDQVKKGDLLLEFDNEAIRAEGYNTVTSMLVCNSQDYTTFQTKLGKNVTNDDVVIALAR